MIYDGRRAHLDDLLWGTGKTWFGGVGGVMGVHGDGRIIDRVAAAAGAEMAPLLAVHKRGSVGVKCHVRGVRRARATWVASWSDACTALRRLSAAYFRERMCVHVYVLSGVCAVCRCVWCTAAVDRRTLYAAYTARRPQTRGVYAIVIFAFLCGLAFTPDFSTNVMEFSVGVRTGHRRMAACPPYMRNLARSRLRHVHVPRACTPSRPFHPHMASIGMRPCSDRSRVARRDDKVSGA